MINILVFFCTLVVGFLLGIIYCKGKLYSPLKESIEVNSKFKEFYDVLVRWVSIKKRGNEVEEFLLSKGYKSIAIYGMRELGIVLYQELKDGSILVKYAIDRNTRINHLELDVYTPEDQIEPVDAIIVTAIHYYEQIKSSLRDRVDCPIISLEDILFNI